ncbi:prisilkin-39-like isoform X1 [Gambusia affinis]|uniref:prisilkin-39-like isoform X1 n=1 Tax=Gambusia affinis TaxID=33528 RepID=UPI001CDD2B5D|nr:prisilkin-39-like isoform X1 [Gambusia affinis]
MKLLACLCLSVFLAHIHLSVAGKIKLSKPFKTTKIKTKNPTSNKGSYPKQPEGGYPQYPGSQPQYPARGYPQYPNQHGGYSNPGGYPGYPARGYPQYPNQHGGYPQYPNQHGGYPQYPNQHGGSPYHGSYPQYPQHPAGHYPAPGYGGGYGNYPGSYINHNPNNRILSPHYGGSFGFGGYGGGGGSPFSHSVQNMGFAPSDQSKGFGRSAAMAAAGGAMAGMALGYGLGKFPHPNFHFHNPHQEYYYNYYMYKRYGRKSSDRDDYSRDYNFNQSSEDFDKFMTSCMKRTDLLPGEKQRSQTKPLTTTTTTTSATNTAITTRSNITAAGNASFTANSTNNPLNESDVTNLKVSQTLQNNEANDDTVSIVEIGYPALINQMKEKRCTELYVVYSEKHLKKNKQSSPHSGKESLQMEQQGLLFVFMSTVMLMLHN